MSFYRSVSVTTLVLLSVLVGCGGSGPLPPPIESLSPATDSIASDGNVPLVLTVSGLCGTCTIPSVFWSIEEDGPGCTWTTTPPAGPCPGGTLQITGANIADSFTATYFAPGTPGTYHVLGQALLIGVAAGESVITVTP